MAEPRLVDAVTLRHFGVIDRFDLLAARLQGYDKPHWTDAVQCEIHRYGDQADCQRVLAMAGELLGDPMTPTRAPDLASVFRFQRALRVGHEDALLHLGEAETIWAADRLDGVVLTDDGEAFAYAEKNLGSNRVFDFVHLLRESVAADEISEHEAKQVAEAVRNSGRYLRAGHPPTLTPEYFRFP